ncbi:hypothetical protein GALL_205820 [mine drainage metagenome]|uniref:DegT/DnrJ/EryC1/StrS aminotransferase family protein n=1 Tax=mine drainage metagenome TaxID=410659 RepID=A0A1J5RPD9_9ZZZZ
MKAITEGLMEIGGYFGLDIPCYRELHPGAIKFQSARAAIRAVLECNGMKSVMMPAYVCSSVIKSAVDAGLEVETYDLDEILYPKNIPRVLPDQCAFVYVNYFGLCQGNVTRLLNTIPRDRLIIDNSHALFSEHTNVLASIYSPRKFAGLPDGGLLKASPLLKVTLPIVEDMGSFERMRYLLVRMAYSAREGYSGFVDARNSLVDNTPLAMSRLTQRLMKSIQWDQVALRRRENFTIMDRMVGAINDMFWVLGEGDVPLCYPLTLRGYDVNRIKIELAERNVFTATYWPDALPRINANTIESAFANETLFIPIDQRLESAQVEAVGRLILKLIET